MTSNKDSVSNHVRKLSKQLHSKDQHDKLFLVACAIELLRRAQQVDAKNPRELVDFMARLTAVAWQSIPFSVTKKVLHDGPALVSQYGGAPDRVNDTLLEALAVFADIVDNGLTAEDAPAEAIFDAVVAELAEASRAPVTAPAPAQAQPEAVEIFNRSMLARIFKPAKLTPQLLEQIGAQPALFKGDMTPDRRGPTLRCFAFDSGVSRWHLILESGEFLSRPKDDPAVCVNYTAMYDDPPIELMLYTTLIAPQLLWMGIVGESQANAIDALGEFIMPPLREFVVKENAIALERVIDIDGESFTLSAAGATGAVGASVRYPVSNTGAAVVIDAVPSEAGPYATAKLVQKKSDGAEKILMRLDYPRQFSARGVYVFPVQGQPVSLAIIY